MVSCIGDHRRVRVMERLADAGAHSCAPADQKDEKDEKIEG
ncbi:hypothetical protein GFS60_07412 (plasmid) [Rhodococcus sp. WAY2]|nr:hypothetical protein GFS60_07412 [Rhodococcus sp. WAY2]